MSRRFVRSQALGLIGGVFALMLMANVSSSGFTDAGGPADWLLIALVFGLGLVGAAIVFYTIAGWWAICRHPEARSVVLINQGVFEMTSNYEDTHEIMGNLAPLHKGLPQVMKGFGDMGKAAMADGALDAKTKELILGRGCGSTL